MRISDPKSGIRCCNSIGHKSVSKVHGQKYHGRKIKGRQIKGVKNIHNLQHTTTYFIHEEQRIENILLYPKAAFFYGVRKAVTG